MTQGTYRLLGTEPALLETFVAAPGPAGWRYFGRIHDVDSGRQLYAVDHVVDLDWRLVRCRLLRDGRTDWRVDPAPDGLVIAGEASEAQAPGAEVAWSPSPSSLIVLRGLLSSTGRESARGVRVGLDGTWDPVALAMGGDWLAVDGQRTRIRLGSEAPEWAEGWFELIS